MKNLITAFVKFQSELKPVTKDSANPFFKSKYADLSSILEEVMPILSRNGLAISQTCKVVDQNTILQTRIMHVSGEELLSEVYLPFLADVQKMGSQITYYKRYSLQAALGVSTEDEDDDGEKTIQRNYNPLKETKKIVPEVKKQGFVLEQKTEVSKNETSAQTEKDVANLLGKITGILGEKTQGMNKEGKVKFMNERLGLKGYGDLMNMKYAQLAEIEIKLSKM